MSAKNMGGLVPGAVMSAKNMEGPVPVPAICLPSSPYQGEPKV